MELGEFFHKGEVAAHAGVYGTRVHGIGENVGAFSLVQLPAKEDVSELAVSVCLERRPWNIKGWLTISRRQCVRRASLFIPTRIRHTNKKMI